MMKLIPLLLVLIIVAVVISCKPTKATTTSTTNTADPVKEVIKEVKENNPEELIGSSWSITYIQELDARFTPKKTASISFKEENQASISLSVNNCVGSYKADATTIKITEEGCTEKCCDDDFDKKLLTLIRANKFSYELNGSKLILSAKNSKIVLSKK